MRPKFLQRTIQKQHDVDITHLGPFVTRLTFVEYIVKPARWPIVALVAAVILFCAVFASAAEKGKPFVPPTRLVPEPEATIRIITDPLPVAAQAKAVCPIDASVIVDVIDGLSHFTGSGTCISSESGESLILTCWHTWRGVKNPDVRVTHEKKSYKATILKQDQYLDLALLSINAELPFVEIAASQPPVGSTIVSIGASVNGNSLVERSHEISLIGDGPGFKPPVFETTGPLQWPGRSGGGAFFRDELCGVIAGFNPATLRASQYAPYSAIRSFLEKPVSSSAPTPVTLWKAPFKCIPCDRSEANIINDPRFDVTVKIGPAPFMTKEWLAANELNGYPYYEIPGAPLPYHGYVNADGLAATIESLKPATVAMAVSSGPVGATIQGRAYIQSAMAIINRVAGSPSSASLTWTRHGAKDALLISETHTREDILGTSGRIELILKAHNNLPVREIKFDYGFDAQGPWVDPDKTYLSIPENNAVGSVDPVGDPFMTAWTVLSVIQFVHALLHPTIDIWLGEKVEATAQFADGSLHVDCGEHPPAIRAHWAFVYGLFKFTKSMALTGIAIGTERVVAEFHQNRRLRDWSLEVTE